MKNILATLCQLEQLLAQLTPEGLSAIERDIVLEKLRSLYESVLTCQSAPAEPKPEEEPVLEMVATMAVAAEQLEEPVEESVIELIEELIDQVEELPEGEDDEPEEEEPAAVEEEPIAVEDEPIEEVAEDPVVAEAPATTKSKIDHKRVLSLYEDDDEPTPAPIPAPEEPAPFPTPEEPTSVVEPIEEEPIEEELVEAEPAEESVATESIADEPADENKEDDNFVIDFVLEPESPRTSEVEISNTVVLGDVLGGEQTTVADKLTPEQTSDVATAAVSGAVSLMSSVSINDKILLMRDLFGGNSRLYEQSMEVLDSYDSLDEAMLFIYDNFDWNPNSEGAKLLMELLSRKLL